MVDDGGLITLADIQRIMAVVSLECTVVLEPPNHQGVPPWAAAFSWQQIADLPSLSELL